MRATVSSQSGSGILIFKKSYKYVFRILRKGLRCPGGAYLSGRCISVVPVKGGFLPAAVHEAGRRREAGEGGRRREHALRLGLAARQRARRAYGDVIADLSEADAGRVRPRVLDEMIAL